MPRRRNGTAVMAAELLGGRKTAVPMPTRPSLHTMGKACSRQLRKASAKSAKARMLMPTVQSIRDPTLSYRDPETGATKNKKMNGTTMKRPTLLTG